MARGDARTDVELVEDDDDGTGAPPGGGTPPGGAAPHGGDDPTGASRRTRRRVLVLGAALVAVLLAVGVVGQAVVASRERARIEAVAGLPGVVDALDGPVRVLRSGADDGFLRASARTPDGFLVASRQGEDGAASVRAFDPADGTVAWEVELIAPRDVLEPLPGGEVVRSGGWCVEYGSDGDLLVCLADDGVSVVGQGTLTQVGPTTTRLLVLDAHDGSVVSDLSAAVGESLSSMSGAVLDDLVVLAGADGSAVHVRAITVDGSVEWEATFPTTTTTAYGSYAEVHATTDGVAVVTADALMLLDASGATVQGHQMTSDSFVRGTAGDAVLVLAQDGETTVVVRPDGVRSLPGRWVTLAVDDGSAPGLLLTSDTSGLHAWDLDGGPLWSSEQPVNQQDAVLLDGRVIAGYATELFALDAGTGAERWRAGGLLPDATVATDGRHVLAMAPPPGGSAPQVLVALDATGGGVAWRVTLPDEVTALRPTHGVLAAYRFDRFDGSTGDAGPVVTVLG
ncbi:outer membrane protein assembly factor BamB family protein [Cellulomonas xiejunii]|uniref:PQQ-binding-like beta-propeller repeat protein n=1 Tax=Cellulomonas xiejunii TaxID=2968083 RepID=A0ABY5KNY8_9CELL|nr:PQQ-binding-like beta-propeller repeat protein [Cellulomonas xiejunii]MCC2321387.1 PQQ-binding-like beta-propeller repeat protein [Cellulomonas xiejunii]UUI71969.1 PQQ-binding-like beta-propeller repeat protein [Cellulomonas xiejunii]